MRRPERVTYHLRGDKPHAVNLALCVRHHAVRSPDRLAVLADDFRQTYKELDEQSDRVAIRLQNEFGVQPGARVAYLMTNRPEIPTLLVAAWKLGAIPVPINFRLQQREIEAIVQNAAPQLLVTDTDHGDAARAAAPSIPTLGIERPSFANPSAVSTMATAALPIVGADDDACIVYTSGTTGLPKGAVFTHAAVMMYAANHALECEMEARSRYLVSLPHHVSVTVGFAPCLYIGSTIVMNEVRSFDGERFLADVNRQEVTHTEIVPTQLYRILEAVRANEASMPSMRTLCYGSSPAAPDRVAEMIRRFGPILMQVYGMTEVGGIATTLRRQEHVTALAQAPERLSSAGQPSYGMHLRVVDESGAGVASGDRGEVWFSSPYMMREYWRNPEQTALALVDGHMRSGDIAEVRDGFLYIVDRKKDLIIRGGQNLSSKEIEEVLFRHPDVLEAAVVAAPHREWGEEPIAVIVMRGEGRPTPEQLQAFCLENGLSRFKTPARFDFVESLPKNSSGKVAKSELRERYRESSAVTNLQG